MNPRTKFKCPHHSSNPFKPDLKPKSEEEAADAWHHSQAARAPLAQASDAAGGGQQVNGFSEDQSVSLRGDCRHLERKCGTPRYICNYTPTATAMIHILRYAVCGFSVAAASLTFLSMTLLTPCVPWRRGVYDPTLNPKPLNPKLLNPKP